MNKYEDREDCEKCEGYGWVNQKECKDCYGTGKKITIKNANKRREK